TLPGASQTASAGEDRFSVGIKARSLEAPDRRDPGIILVAESAGRIPFAEPCVRDGSCRNTACARELLVMARNQAIPFGTRSITDRAVHDRTTRTGITGIAPRRAG